MDSEIAETSAALVRNAFNPVYPSDFESGRACKILTSSVGA